LIEPVDQRLSAGEEAKFTKIARGETLKVVIKKKSDLSVEWDSISVDQRLLPANWTVQTTESDESLIANVTIARDAQVSSQKITFIAGNKAEPSFNETFYGNVSVHENLLSASIENRNQAALLGEQTTFFLVLSNDSIARQMVEIESDLPSYWFEAWPEIIEPHETIVVDLNVSPYSYGEKNFSFTVYSSLNDQTFDFPASMNVKPTLVGMFQAPIAGFPFFSPAMLSYYLINGFLSIFN